MIHGQDGRGFPSSSSPSSHPITTTTTRSKSLAPGFRLPSWLELFWIRSCCIVDPWSCCDFGSFREELWVRARDRWCGGELHVYSRGERKCDI